MKTPEQMRGLLFLDFDGVLNSTEWFRNSRASRQAAGTRPEHEEEMIDPGAIWQLNRILDESGCDVVISSTWRRGRTIGELLRILVKRGLNPAHWDRFIGATPALESKLDSGLYKSVERGHEIQAWLDAHPELSRSIVILDDDGDMAHLMPHLVLTHGIEGLTKEKANEVIAKLRNHLPRAVPGGV